MLVAGVFVSLQWYGSCLGMLYSVIWLPGGPDGLCYYLPSLSLVNLIHICLLIGWVKCRKRVRSERDIWCLILTTIRYFHLPATAVTISSSHLPQPQHKTQPYLQQLTSYWSTGLRLTSYWSTGLRLVKTMEIISLCVTNWSAFLSACLRFPDLTFSKWWLAQNKCTEVRHQLVS